MVLAILGRQPKLGMAELERLYGATALTPAGDSAVLVDIPLETILSRPLGGSMKLAQVLTTFDTNKWQTVGQKTVQFLQKNLPSSGKVTLGFSAYDFAITSRDIQKIGIILKQKTKQRDGSVRIIPQTEIALNTAQVLHNKLGTAEHKKEIILVNTGEKTIVAETKQVQDIDAYTFRDLGRPQRDAFVGMLPPKLAQIMINLGTASQSRSLPTPQKDIPFPGLTERTFVSAVGPFGGGGEEANAKMPRLLDPFCGTGVVLQEAALMRYAVYGTDLSEKMIRYSRDNLNWLQEKYYIRFDWYLHEADARTEQWQQPIDAVVCETYLGQPFSTEPNPEKLTEVRHECNSLLRDFLKNLAPQLTAGTPLCLAVPAWHTKNGIYHLSVLDDLAKLGYNRIDFTCASHAELIYHREDQIVGRELLVLTRS